MKNYFTFLLFDKWKVLHSCKHYLLIYLLYLYRIQGTKIKEQEDIQNDKKQTYKSIQTPRNHPVHIQLTEVVILLASILSQY